ncbi:MAG: hypothetical protein IJI14_16185 [Anaerolineaceae bacterium]|nr:hypothetical protein [Anaerolineaceae bacterium]
MKEDNNNLSGFETQEVFSIKRCFDYISLPLTLFFGIPLLFIVGVTEQIIRNIRFASEKEQ